MSYQRVILLFFGDTHGGHKLGLLNPKVTLFDTDEKGNRLPYYPALTAVQKYLLGCFTHDLIEVSEIAEDDPVVAVHVGDIGHGAKYPEQLVSTRPADQIQIAVGNMEMLVRYLPTLKTIRIIHGTQAHTFGESTIPIVVAGFLDAKYPDIGVGSLAHALFALQGKNFDCAHHGPSPGIRSWTIGNRLRLYTRSMMQDSINAGEEPPYGLIRCHFHTGVHETVRLETKHAHYVTEAFILPSYCGLSEYGQQATRSKNLISNGLLVFEIEDGRVIGCHKLWRWVDLRTREDLGNAIAS